LFVNIQHPGESPSERANPDQPTAISSWPGGQFPALGTGRPRSATIAIRHIGGGTIGEAG
jgi:secreted PhoX family phosphatase